ncbi:MAG: diaminopimelate decarboxylase [Actinomycetota bacterium]|nr:diaminopimelate decarboxylase [Actinomycetota bacterium]
MNPLSPHLLPLGAATNSEGKLELHNVGFEELVQAYGTPLFVYDTDDIVDKVRRLVGAARWKVAYASKAFLSVALLNILKEFDILLDVASGGELAVARAAGFPGSRLIFHGNNKSSSELGDAISYGVGLIVVDSFNEIERLIETTVGSKQSVPVLVRVTPGVEAHTHEYIMTGQEDSKFGFSVSSGAANRAIETILEAENLKFMGIHAHIGSQIFLLESFRKEVEALAPLLRDYRPRVINLGGGIGVAYLNYEESGDFDIWAKTLTATLDELALDFDYEVIVEPGRAIVASSALTFYTVGTLKEVEGVRTYLAVDGGMSDNPRPVIYDSGYEAFLPRAVASDRDKNFRIVGKHCESGDVIIKDAFLPGDVVVGDVIATPVTGAYGYSMASNYNRVPRPPVVFVNSSGHRLAIRGENYDDLLRLEVY